MFRRWFVIFLCCTTLPACGWVNDAGVKLFGDGFFKDDEDARIKALTEFKPRLKLKQIWNHSVGGAASGSYFKLIPLVQGDTVFASDPKGEIRALSARSGKQLWAHSFNATISFGVGGSGRTLMIGTATGEVIAFAANSGKQLWRQRVSGEGITAISAKHRGLVLVRDSGGGIAALAVEDGEKLWQFETKLPTLTLRGMSIPVLYEDFGFVGLDDGRLLIVALDSGRIQREIRIGLVAKGSDLEQVVDIDGQFEIYDGVLYVATYRGRTLALDIETQSTLWVVEAESYAGLDVDEEFVYMVGTGGEVLALDRFNGSEAWSNSAFAVRDLSAPLVSGEMIVVGDNLGYLYWLSKKTGAILARSRIARAPIMSAPVAWRRHVIALDRGGQLTATKVAARLVARAK